MMSKRALKDISILLVSKDNTVLDRVTKLIDSFGVEQIECTDSYEGAVNLACTQKKRFDLVIASMVFEKEPYTGIEVCRRVKVEDPRTLCLIFSAQYTDAELLHLLSCNIDGLIDTNNMMKIITKWIAVLTKRKMLQNILYGKVEYNNSELERIELENL